MSELILFFVVATLLLLSQLLIRRLKKPLQHYIRIATSIALLILIWFFGGNSNIPTKAILSAVVLTVIYKEYMTLKKAGTN